MTPGPFVFGSLLYNADQQIAEFVRERVPHVRMGSFGLCTALGVMRAEKLVGGIVFHNYRGHDIEISIAFDDPRWCLPGTLRDLFAYPFVQLGCVRITAFTGRKSKNVRRLMEGLGFVLEGTHRKALDGKQDACSYRMLKEECRWLKGRATSLSGLACASMSDERVPSHEKADAMLSQPQALLGT